MGSADMHNFSLKDYNFLSVICIGKVHESQANKKEAMFKGKSISCNECLRTSLLFWF